jgi:ABC-type sugar transport system substrate-binding protein
MDLSKTACIAPTLVALALALALASAMASAMESPPADVTDEVIVVGNRQQEAYRSKLRQVAEQHPEFLNALVNYVDARKQYEDAVDKARK